MSHSNRKTKCRFLPNLCNVTLTSDALNRRVRLRVTAHALRRSSIAAASSLPREGAEVELSQTAKLLKREIHKKLGETAAPEAVAA